MNKEKLCAILVNDNESWTGEEILNRLNEAGFEVVEKLNDEEYLIPVYKDYKDGWCMYDLNKMKIVNTGYDSIHDVERAIETRAYRIKQGWKP